MPTLLETERSFARAILCGADGDLAQFITPAAIPAEEAIAIYRNTFISGATRALRLTFPAVERLTGADFFDAAAAQFIEANPPSSGCFDDYGENFPTFLASLTPVATTPYLPDVARLEWSVNKALRAADVAPLKRSDLELASMLDPAMVILRPDPSVSLVATQFPADAIWRAVLDDDEAEMAEINLGGGPFQLLIARNENGVEVLRLPPSEWRLLSSLCSGATLADSLVAAESDDVSMVLARCFAQSRFIAFEEKHS